MGIFRTALHAHRLTYIHPFLSKSNENRVGNAKRFDFSFRIKYIRIHNGM